MPDALFFLSLTALFIAPFFLMPRTAGRWRWVTLFLGFAAVLAVCEAASALATKATLSQLFWRWSETNPAAAWAVLACLAVGWVLVIIHMARKLLRRKR